LEDVVIILRKAFSGVCGTGKTFMWQRKQEEKGVGKNLMLKTFEEAKNSGYTHMYLESFPSLTKAIEMYEYSGFKKIDHPMGNSGHFACNVWMVKEL